MNSHQVKKGRVTVASATVAHVLGWAAFLWIVLGSVDIWTAVQSRHVEYDHTI